MKQLHPVMQAALAGIAPPPRFSHTYCSQCGQPQGPGSSGFSSCKEHRAIAADLAYNALKNTGELSRMEAGKALAEQVKWSAA